MTRVRIDCPEGSFDSVIDLLAELDPPAEPLLKSRDRGFVVTALTDHQINHFRSLDFNVVPDQGYHQETATAG